ncbi:acyltransferase family protein [Spartinivicinus poritis]|uniref:Acyltransferase n=1 Tax=Spartinivicinus poritis TaxID=2994640 RepID=A0ABT5UFL1_9GAMM|nr:acyltransferase [Spartinivicinus sp. A2-2]MDE1465174.1 acyltransferase [Spartinivicinus sp. A2-2]
MNLEVASLNRNNNFNFVRFVAAFAVLYRHMFDLSFGVPHTADPIEKIFSFSVSSIAVDAFFFTSGYLVYKSLVLRRNLISFTMSRILRVFPALIIALLFSIVVVGGLSSSLNSLDYFTSTEVWSYFVNNIFLFDGVIQYYLPEVFTDNPYPNAVNGSLWTLPGEVHMYILIGFFYFFGVTESKDKVSSICLFIFFIYILNHIGVFNLDGSFKIYLKFFVMFFSGVLYYLFAEKIKLNLYLFVVAMFFLVFFFNNSFVRILYPLLLGYVILYFVFAVKGKVLYFNKFGDYSYGIYIFSFPIQQLVIYFLIANESFTFKYALIISAFLTLLLSIFSWHAIEKPVLGLKKYFS